LRGATIKELLKNRLNAEDLGGISLSYDVIGDIAVVKFSDKWLEKETIIANTILENNRHIKTVLRQASPVEGAYRTRKLEWIAGEQRTETVHREYNCTFKVDLSKVYFSPRLSFERLRVARLVKPKEVVINMFAGVGCFSIFIGKYSEATRVYSIDINPEAVRLMEENIRLNGLDDRIFAIRGDARDIVGKGLKGVADRVLMPLPEKAFDYLEDALHALKPKGGWIHYYDFAHSRKYENPVAKISNKVSSKLRKLGTNITENGKIVRSVGPNWYQVVLDLMVS